MGLRVYTGVDGVVGEEHQWGQGMGRRKIRKRGVGGERVLEERVGQ